MDALCTVLGPLRVHGSIPGSPQQRRLLAALLVHRGTPVSADLLADIVWHGRPPPSATNALQSKVSRLRGVLPAEAVRHVPAGYLLTLDAHDCDADRFCDLVDAADGLAPADRLAVLDQALRLWQGRAYEEFADEDFARAAAVRLEQRRLLAHEQRFEALLATDRPDEVLAGSEAVLQVDPYREAFWAARIRAFALTGRPVDAVRCYQDAREQFIEDTGIEPSPFLADLERAVLAGEITRERAEPTGPPDAPPGPGPTTPLAAIPAPPWRPLGDVAPHPVPLVERENARAHLRDALERARSGHPALVLVQAPAGGGKTRLLAGALAAAREAGARILTGRCVPDLHTPLGPLGQVVAALGLRASAAGPAGSSAVDPTVERDPMAPTVALVGALLDRLQGMLTVLVLEDLHWADATTIAALDLLLAEADTRAATGVVPLLIVATHRVLDPSLAAHATLDRLGRTPSAELVTLPPLSEAGVATIVQTSLGLRPTGSLLRTMLDHSAGSPLLVCTLLRHWAADGTFVTRRGTVDVAARAEAMGPADIDRAAIDVLGRLDPDAIDILAAAAASRFLDAVVPSAAAALLGIVLDRPATEIIDALDRAVDGQAVQRGPAGYRITHPRVREALIGGLTGRRADELHRRAAAALLGPDPRGSDGPAGDMCPALVVFHLLATSPVDRATVAEWATAATADCLASGAWGDAAHHAATAIDHGARVLPDGSPLALVAGLAHFRDHDEANAQARFEQAATDAERDGDDSTQGRARLMLHRLAMAITDPSRGRIAADTARAQLLIYVDQREADPDLAARAAAQLAEEAAVSGELTRAQDWMAQARAIATAADHEVLVAEIDFAEGLVDLGRLDFRAAEAHFTACRQRAVAEGDPWVASWGAGRLSLLRVLTGDRLRARLAIEDALDLQVPLRHWSELALTRAAAASLAASAGSWDKAVALAEESERLAIRAGYPFARLIAVPVLAYSATEQGDPARARELVPRLTEPFGRAPWPYLALIDSHSGELDRAVAACRARRHRLEGAPTLDRLPAIVATAIIAAAAADAALADAVVPALDEARSRGVAALPGWPIPLVTLLARLSSPSVSEAREAT